jgi:hypothetical protein
MAFPGTFNISYYKGDTYEFNIYPKDSSGQPFDLTGYSATFTIASSRGPAPTTTFSGYALIPADAASVRCAILPSDAAEMISGNSYVYDIEISNNDEALPYPLVYTLLTGSVSVTSDITGAV